jgi:hypothetical protein
MGAKLLKAEILALKSASFMLPQWQVISPRRLFGRKAGIELVYAYYIPLSPNEHRKIQARKIVARIQKHQQQSNKTIVHRHSL